MGRFKNGALRAPHNPAKSNAAYKFSGLAFATFGAICGSSTATAATMAQVSLPELKRYGYADSLATGTLAAGGTLGILAVIAVEVGLITPPIGINIFVINAIAKDVPMMECFKGILPFLVSDIVRVAIIVLIPAPCLWLPGVT